MNEADVLEKEKKSSPNGTNMEEITVRIIKCMLEENVSMEDIQYITKKSVEEIKRIGGLAD